MLLWYWGVALVFIIGLAFWLLLWPIAQRILLRRKGFPKRWQLYLQPLPWFSKLTPSRQQQLKQRILFFLAGVTFYGCNGQKIDDRVKVIIAAHASLLTLNLPFDVFHRIRSVLVYPEVFIVRRDHHEGALVTHQKKVLAGESWPEGRVILSWGTIESDLCSHRGNVIIHEFAHQLDALDGEHAGIPPMSSAAAEYWQEVMDKARDHLKEALAEQRDHPLDPYALSNNAEFFAVASEAYFIRSQQLKENEPELFQLLYSFYGEV